MNELRQAYARGFMAKCAELGVDPEILVKNAGVADIAGKALNKAKDIGKAIGKGAVKAKDKAKAVGKVVGPQSKTEAATLGGAMGLIAGANLPKAQKKSSAEKQAVLGALSKSLSVLARNPAAGVARAGKALQRGGQVAGQQGRSFMNALTGKSVNRLAGKVDGLAAHAESAAAAGGAINPLKAKRLKDMQRMLADAKMNRNLVRGVTGTGVAGVGYNMLTDHD